MKLFILLACLAVVARSGPLPACLWDEAIEGSLSESGETAAKSAVCSSFDGLRSLMPVGDDTPDQIVHDILLHQSLGTLHQTPISLHVDPSAWGGCIAAIFPAPDALGLGFFAGPVLIPPEPGHPPSPPGVLNRPLLA
jgi:hypothetical protein